jgi:hypothetical protein
VNTALPESVIAPAESTVNARSWTVLAGSAGGKAAAAVAAGEPRCSSTSQPSRLVPS